MRATRGEHGVLVSDRGGQASIASTVDALRKSAPTLALAAGRSSEVAPVAQQVAKPSEASNSQCVASLVACYVQVYKPTDK